MRALLSIAAVLGALALLLSLRSGEQGRAQPALARAASPAAAAGEPLPSAIEPESSAPPGERIELPETDPRGAGVPERPAGEHGLVLEGCVYRQVGPGLGSTIGSPFVRPERLSGEPVFVTQAGASVRARWFDGYERGALGGTLSDAGGRWRIEADARALPLSRVQIEVVAEADGHPSETRRTSGPRSLPAVLSFDHALSGAPAGQGRVLDERGEPVPYAEVTLWSVRASDAASAALLHHTSVLCNEDGRYALELPETVAPEASFTLSTRHDGRACTLELAASHLLQRLPDLVLFDAQPSLAGRVVAADGRALPGVRVAARLGEASYEAWTDGAGGFRLADLAPGTWDVGVPWDANATVRATPPCTDLELRVGSPCAIVSVVDTSGRLVRGPIQAFARHADGRTDELGTLRTNLNETGSAIFPFEDGVVELEILFDASPEPPLRRLVAREERTQEVRLVVGRTAARRGSEQP